VTEEDGPGRLVVVGTPIGNLGDLSRRAVDALGDADVVYCEDTRRTRGLLSHAAIRGATLRSLHGHNEAARVEAVLGALGAGRTVAVVTDAGMPGVSDPGARVVAAASAAGFDVSVVPGPSAVTAAVAGSGMDAARFCFEGFLPRSGAARRTVLAALAGEPRTTVLFEAPGRVRATLADLAEACGPEREVVIARELTKLHEEFWRGTLVAALERVDAAPVRGEVVLVLAGNARGEEVEVDDARLSDALAERLGPGTKTREVVDEVAADFGVPRRRVYDLALALRGSSGGRT
jgi:16S rRNA (cytidine1402-2'-O)-methyltransferase